MSIGEGAFGSCHSLTSIVVAEGNTAYDSRENCNALIHTATNTLICGCKNTTIPDSVTSIGDEAFRDCDSMQSVTIPDNVVRIGENAYRYCDSLKSVFIGNGVTSIGDWAFCQCESLEAIIIGNSVTSIGASAFNSCKSLTNITIPNNVTSIEHGAFYNCHSLITITFQGTKAQWKELKFGKRWDNNISATVVHCADGDVEI
jgi:hypothetical protein